MPRDTRYTNNEPDGTPFQELVMFPTLAPQLARPQRAAPPRAPGALPVAGTAEENNDLSDFTPPERTFFITAILSFRESSASQGSKAKQPKKTSATKTGPALPLFSMTRCAVLQEVLKLHDLHQHYQPSNVSGFPVEISWPGSPGGKTNAPTVRDDQEFETIMTQLYEKRTVKSILVGFDLDLLEPFRIRSAVALDPRLAPWSGPKVRFGTHVPRPDSFSGEDQLHGAIIMDLREEWKCDEHDNGACYKKEDEHFPLNRWKVKHWAAAIAGSQAGVSMRDPPPTLFRPDDAIRSRVIRPRGRTGPRHQRAGSDSAVEAGTMMSAFFSSLLQNNVAFPPVTPRRPKKHYLSPASSPAGPPESSSPLPAQEDELRLCLEAFGCAKPSISPEEITVAVTALSEKHYTADTLSFAGVQRLAEVTQFAEGDVCSLLKFAKEWVGKVEHKRARLSTSSHRF